MTEAKINRLRFRDERIRKLNDGELPIPIPLDGIPRVILHMIPATPLENSNFATVSDSLKFRNEVNPISADCVPTFHVNEDGLMSVLGRGDSAYSYLQVFTDGTVEAVRATYYSNDKPLIHKTYERELLKAIPQYLRAQEQLGVSLPISILVTLSGGINGFALGDDTGKQISPKITSSRLQFPEVLVTHFDPNDAELAELMEPIFKRVRNP